MELKNKKILVITQIFPYPLHDGGRFDVYYRLKALFKLGYDVTLVAFYNPALPQPELEPLLKLCARIISIPYLRRQWSKILHWKPYSIASRENKEQVNQAIASLRGEPFQAVLAESHHVLTMAREFQKGLGISKCVLRSHNNEPRYMLSLAQTSPKLSIQQLFFFVEACKYACYHPVLMRSMRPADAIFHISHDECEKGKQNYPGIEQYFLPAGIDLSQLRSYNNSAKCQVLFAGALFSPNNLQGLQWYIEKVHPHLVESIPGYQLIVAGNTKGADQKLIARMLASHSAIRFHDTPADMTPIYEKAQVFINPMQYGAGVKLKTVDALLKGLPVVTTTIGNEGTGFQHFQHVFVADDPMLFAESIQLLLDSDSERERIVGQAQEFLEKHYDQKKALEQLL